MNIGNGIRVLRNEKFKHLTQAEFGKRIGITQTYLSQIENNSKTPSTDVLQKCALEFNVPLAVLFWFTIEEKDVSENKKFAYRFLKPAVDAMLREIF